MAVFVDLTLHVVDLPEGDRVVVGLHALPPSGDGVVVVPLVSQGLACNITSYIFISNFQNIELKGGQKKTWCFLKSPLY